jgi:metallo-beta-lactamase family protein
MAKKKENQIKVSFVGGNAYEVTGSMTLIEFGNKKILLEAGLFQSNSLKEDYKFNSRKFDFKPKEIDFIFISHFHIDHIGLLPKLYKEGCMARIICVKDSSKFIYPMLKDSAFIMQRDCEMLNKKSSDVEYKPIYFEEDVNKTVEHIEEYNYGQIIQLDNEISFKFISAYHIIRSAQIELYIKQGNHTEKILYTGDLGNVAIKNKHYVEQFEHCKNASLVIGECTYSGRNDNITDKDRQKDIEKIKSVILETCYDKHGQVLIPSFSLDRTQSILTILYELFGNNPVFEVPVIIDSPLTCAITEIYGQVLCGEELELFKKVCGWKNVRFIKDINDSKACMNDNRPKIVISSSGMMNQGRSKSWSKVILPNPYSTILFIGYSALNTLASKIKSGNKQKTIFIDGKSFKNKCAIVDLHSFSGHMQQQDLLNYYSNIQAEKIALVHSNFKNKCEFSQELQEMISKKNKTSRVIVVNKETKINL